MNLADNVFVIGSAYVAAFLPWTAMASSDFIDSSRKSVRDTRREGFFHLMFVSLPTAYMIFYIVLQTLAEDYKEMFTAIVALLFSILHLVRTAWGLWQLAEFRRWAAASISALRAMGIEYKATHCDASWDPIKIADALEVNNQIVDNQILHGETRCYIRCGSHSLRLPENKMGIIKTRLMFSISVALFPFRVLRSFVSYSMRRGERPLLAHVPHHPIHVTLNWVTCFAAQGLGEWIKAFQAAQEPGKRNGDDIDAAEEIFKDRQKYFAAEVLGSAALHFYPPAREGGEVCSPILWEEWPGLSSDCCEKMTEVFANRRSQCSGTQDVLLHGLFTKQELFHLAICSGESLPFKASQCSSLPLEEAGYGDGSNGYALYENELNVSIAAMPAAMRESLSGFNTRLLDWLVVILHLGTLSLKRKDTTEFHSDTELVTSTPNLSKSFLDFQFGHMTGSLDVVSRKDMAVQNLRVQLGSQEEKLADSVNVGEYVSGLSSFPMPRKCISYLSTDNKVVLVVSEFIDLWLSLLTGEQVAHLQSDRSIWQYQPMVCSEDEHGRVCLRMRSSEPDTLHFAEPDAESKMGMLGYWYYRLERARLEYQFAEPSHPFWHLEQSLTFMGYGMELVRSHLAFWRCNNSAISAEKWYPRIEFSADYDFMRTETIQAVKLKDSFAVELIQSLRSSNEQYLRRKSVQVRLLWVLQQSLQQNVRLENDGPWSTLLMMSCILSFPSLSVKRNSRREEHSDQTSQSSNDHWSIPMDDGKATDEANTQPVRIELGIHPQGAPQSLYLIVTLKEQKNSVVSISLSLARRNKHEDPFFVWEWWRDAFEARLRGLSDWQKSHSLPHSPVHCTNRPIGEGKAIMKPRSTDSKAVVTWAGWSPFRYEIIRFELESPDFLWQYARRQDQGVSRMTRLNSEVLLTRNSQMERVCVSYGAAYRETIRNALYVVQEVILEGEEELPSGTTSLSQQAAKVREKARGLIFKDNPEVDRAIHLFELAAVELNCLESMGECVRLLAKARIPAKFERGLAVLDTCLFKRITDAESAEHEPALSAEETSTFQELYLLLSGKRNVNATISFVRFLGLSGLQADRSGELRRAILRCTFIRTRDFRMIQGLGDASSDGYSRASLYSRAGQCGRIMNAMYNHALILQKGVKLPRDTQKAAELYEELINHDGADVEIQNMARNNLAVMLMRGDGIGRDVRTAVTLLEQAHEREMTNLPALRNLLATRRDYRVLISMAGKDRMDVGVPLYDQLMERDVYSCLDVKETRGNSEVSDMSWEAMMTAEVMVVVLSPEYVSRKWGLKELRGFVARGGKLVAVFYRLTMEECEVPERMLQKVETSAMFMREGFFHFEVGEMNSLEVLGLIKRMSEADCVLENSEGVLNEEDCEEEIVENRIKRELFVANIADAVCSLLHNDDGNDN